MLLDARLFEHGTVIDADLCIVGGGAAGLTLAREFIGTPTRVCLLESGGREPDAETQSLDTGDNVGLPYYPLHTARSRTLGGSAGLWHVPLGGAKVGARMRPLDAIDFERRDWVPYSGWPFGKAALEGYYTRAQEVCRLGPPTFAARDWDEQRTLTTMPAPDADVEVVIYKFCLRDVFTREYPAEVAAAPNITTCLHGHVLEVVTGENGKSVERVDATTLNGRHFAVRARAFVLAAGGIETARLLLLSNRHQPTGLGNQHDLVGRFFMEHPHFWSGLLVPHTPAIFARTALLNDIQHVRGTAIVGKLALREETLRRERLLNQNVQLFVRPRPDPFVYPPFAREPVEAVRTLFSNPSLSSAASAARTSVVGWRDLATAAARRTRRLPTTPVYVFANMTEQAPNPLSRVTLGSEVDRFGQRKVRLDWQLTRQDVASALRTQDVIGGALERAGWGRFHREFRGDGPPPETHGGYHHMGTTRMHVDPRQGVVDSNCRIHGTANAYVAGPSVFPTGGYANPVLTVVALTLKLADHLKQHADGGRP